MSRREGRDSDSRRHRSRFDREPSPKRSRRDGKPATARVPSGSNLHSGDQINKDQSRPRKLQDVLPLEAPLVNASKSRSGTAIKESDKKTNGLSEEPNHSSNPTDVPRTQSYFQHDERGNAGQVGRSSGRGPGAERDSRGDSRDRKHEREADKKEAKHKDEKSQGEDDNKGTWCHDRYFKLDVDPPSPPPPPARKKRAFREEKIPLDSENVDKAAAEPTKSNSERATSASEKREERCRNPHHLDGSNKSYMGDRWSNRGEARRGGYLSRQRNSRVGGGGGGGGGDYRRRDRFDGRQEYRSSGTNRGEKWKHDLFQEANRSPNPKDEEDQIAKVEALLAS